MRPCDRTWRSRVAAFLVLFTLVPWASWAGEGVVRDVRPEGIVVDVRSMPGVQPGRRVMFFGRSPSRPEVGEGWVLDVQAGNALIGVKAGSRLTEGDAAVLCPSPAAADPHEALRRRLTQLHEVWREGPPEVRSRIWDVQAALDRRDAVVRNGACDTTAHDGQIAFLVAELDRLPDGATPRTVQPEPPSRLALQSPSAALAPARVPDATGESGKKSLDSALDSINKTVDTVNKVGDTVQNIMKIGRRNRQGVPDSALPAPAGPQPGSQVTSVPSAAMPVSEALVTVRGVVRSESGQPLRGATVVAPEWIQTTATAADGSYSLQGPAGKITIRAFAPGYMDATRSLMIPAGSVGTVDVMLQSAGNPSGSRTMPVLTNPSVPERAQPSTPSLLFQR